tara:strand:- start:3749 stop:5782 length:2034 start_codon:yes stop_codon:yes gene_type:complete
MNKIIGTLNIVDMSDSKEIKTKGEELSQTKSKESAQKLIDKLVVKEADISDNKLINSDNPKPLKNKEESEEGVLKTSDIIDNISDDIETSSGVNEVKDIIIEESDNSSKETKIIQYDNFSIEELTDELEKLIKTEKISQIKSSTDAIKNIFNLKFGKLLAEKKTAFLSEGGNSIDFQFSSPIKSRYNKLLSDYKKQREAYYSKLEKQLKANLEKRVQVIEDLKSLIENADTNTMYKSFRNLQNTWRSIGSVPKTKYNDTWKIYHHHVERFYDLLHLSNDFRDLDFKNNLEEKLKLIQKAESLAEEKDINFAFKQLQELHKRWKEDIGPVSREMREGIWSKFSAATKIIHDKRHGYYRDMKSQYGEIIEAKLLVVEEILNFDSSKNKTHNDWQKSIRDIETLRKKYFDVGKLPYSKSESVWQKFKEATKKFNKEKNKFYKKEKSSQQKNLHAKQELIKLAESLKDSDDWESATNTFKKIQSDWKKIGHVPRKFSDDIWKKFKAACNHYFDRYHTHKNTMSSEQKEILDKKVAFVESLKAEDYSTKDHVSDLLNKWNQFGSSPRGSKAVDVEFNKFIDFVLSSIAIPKDEIVLLKFKNIINGYLANNDSRKLDSELMFIRKKIEETIREIQQLENNLSFFSNASDDNPLMKSVHKSINDYKDALAIWKNKLVYIRSLDY